MLSSLAFSWPTSPEISPLTWPTSSWRLRLLRALQTAMAALRWEWLICFMQCIDRHRGAHNTFWNRLKHVGNPIMHIVQHTKTVHVASFSVSSLFFSHKCCLYNIQEWTFNSCGSRGFDFSEARLDFICRCCCRNTCQPSKRCSLYMQIVYYTSTDTCVKNIYIYFTCLTFAFGSLSSAHLSSPPFWYAILNLRYFIYFSNLSVIKSIFVHLKRGHAAVGDLRAALLLFFFFIPFFFLNDATVELNGFAQDAAYYTQE